MFTGLIEAVGEVVRVEAREGGQRLHLRTPLARELSSGESLAVNGVCLTMTVDADDLAHADIGPETARLTTLGALRAASRVNLERAMRADARLGGHFVQGHVDGTAAVRQIRAEGDSHWLTIELPEALAALVIPKGSIAVDGISLTIAALRDASACPPETPPGGKSAAGGEFDVMIVPFTWLHTNLPDLAAGSRVNLECDMIGKYVARVAASALNKV